MTLTEAGFPVQYFAPSYLTHLFYGKAVRFAKWGLYPYHCTGEDHG